MLSIFSVWMWLLVQTCIMEHNFIHWQRLKLNIKCMNLSKRDCKEREGNGISDCVVNMKLKHIFHLCISPFLVKIPMKAFRSFAFSFPLHLAVFASTLVLTSRRENTMKMSSSIIRSECLNKHIHMFDNKFTFELHRKN